MNRKKFIFILVAALLIFGIFYFIFSKDRVDKGPEILGAAHTNPSPSPSPSECNDPNGPYELSEIAYEIHTTNGELDLPEGTMIGGNPYDYIETTEDETFQTTGGERTCFAYAKIDCEHEPWEPDPCNGS